MNPDTSSEATGIPAPPPPVPGPLPEDAPLGSLFEALLKRPASVVASLLKNGGITRKLLLIALAGMVVFGLVIGSFSGGVQWWAAPLKLAGGLLLAGLMCLPSLYVLSCLGGADVRFSSMAGLLTGALSLTGLLLIAFAPVLWVFSQSTSSIGFMGFLTIAIWGIALFFGIGLLRRGAKLMGMTDGVQLHLWTAIFCFVTFQMSTALRPIIGTADTLLPGEKKFFLQHWGESLNDKSYLAGKPAKIETPASETQPEASRGSR